MSVKVVRERSDQRRHHRVTAPLFVTYGGHTVRAADWSLGGLKVTGFPGELPQVGAAIALDIKIPFQGFDVGFDCEAEVVRADAATATFAVRFTRLGERERGLMEHFIEELIRGSMMDVADTIQRIDVPVTPASTKPDANPLDRIPVARWPTRTIAYTALYFTLGFFVFGYALVLAYANFVRMSVDTAVISAPIESVRAQVEGRITYGKYAKGSAVPAGALILHVVDHELEKEIDLATLDIKEKSAQLAAFQHQLAEEMARVDAFATVEQKNVDQLRLEHESLSAQAKAAAAQHERLQHLLARGFTTATLAEAAEKQRIALEKQAAAKLIELQSRSRLAQHNAGERLYTGQTFFGDRAKIEAQVMLGRQQIAIAEQKLSALLTHKARLAIYAPFDGILQDLPRVNGSMVRKGDVIAVLENPHAREVTAFLRQDEVLSVGLGDEVSIYMPGLSELRKGRVRLIDRTSGFISEMDSTYIWRAPRDRSARVVASFTDEGGRPAADSYRTGLPAVMIFSTRPTNYLVGDMLHRFRMVFGGRVRKAPEPATAESPSAPGTPTQEPSRPASEPDSGVSSLRPSLSPAESAQGTPRATGLMPQTELAGRDFRPPLPTVEGLRDGLGRFGALARAPGLAAEQADTLAAGRRAAHMPPPLAPEHSRPDGAGTPRPPVAAPERFEAPRRMLAAEPPAPIVPGPSQVTPRAAEVPPAVIAPSPAVRPPAVARPSTVPSPSPAKPSPAPAASPPVAPPVASEAPPEPSPPLAASPTDPPHGFLSGLLARLKQRLIAVFTPKPEDEDWGDDPLPERRASEPLDDSMEDEPVPLRPPEPLRPPAAREPAAPSAPHVEPPRPRAPAARGAIKAEAGTPALRHGPASRTSPVPGSARASLADGAHEPHRMR